MRLSFSFFAVALSRVSVSVAEAFSLVVSTIATACFLLAFLSVIVGAVVSFGAGVGVGMTVGTGGGGAATVTLIVALAESSPNSVLFGVVRERVGPDVAGRRRVHDGAVGREGDRAVRRIADPDRELVTVGVAAREVREHEHRAGEHRRRR